MDIQDFGQVWAHFYCPANDGCEAPPVSYNIHSHNFGGIVTLNEVSMRILQMLVAAALLFPAVGQGHCEDAYPTRPVRLIVNFAAGGTADFIARTIQPLVERQLGQPIVIENRGGAGGVLGTDAVAKAPPDGYVVGVGGVGSLAINVAMQERMPYEPLRDLVPVTLLAQMPIVLAASPTLPVNSLRDVIALAKSSGRLSIGHGGNGSAMHLTAQLFNQVAGLELTLVPYKGSAPLAGDVLAGHIPLGVIDLGSVSLIKDGLIKPLAVSSSQRASLLPDLPTFGEAGLPGVVSGAWLGVVLPAGTPATTVGKLNSAIAVALNDPDVQRHIRQIGAEPTPTTPAEFDQFIRDEIAKWSKVVASLRTK